MKAPSEHSRRVVTIAINQIDVAEIFRRGFNGATVARLSLPIAQIPEDAEVVRVWYDVARQSFIFALCHASFEIVPQACLEPELFVDVVAREIRPYLREETEAMRAALIAIEADGSADPSSRNIAEGVLNEWGRV